MLLPTLIYQPQLCLELASLHVARSGRNLKVSVEFSSDHICSGAKEMPTYGKKMQPSMCLGCWNSAVKKFSACDLWEGRCMYCQLLSHLFKKKPKQNQTKKLSMQWSNKSRMRFLATPNISILLQSTRLSWKFPNKKSCLFTLEVMEKQWKSVGMLYALWFLLSCWCPILKRASALLFNYSSPCPLDEFLCVYVHKDYWLRRKQGKLLEVVV